MTENCLSSGRISAKECNWPLVFHPDRPPYLYGNEQKEGPEQGTTRTENCSAFGGVVVSTGHDDIENMRIFPVSLHV